MDPLGRSVRSAAGATRANVTSRREPDSAARGLSALQRQVLSHRLVATRSLNGQTVYATECEAADSELPNPSG